MESEAFLRHIREMTAPPPEGLWEYEQFPYYNVKKDPSQAMVDEFDDQNAKAAIEALANGIIKKIGETGCDIVILPKAMLCANGYLDKTIPCKIFYSETKGATFGYSIEAVDRLLSANKGGTKTSENNAAGSPEADR